MSDFERERPRCRGVAVHFGDTMLKIAARELGDANRWPELVWINDLRSPYIVDYIEQKVDGTLAPGDTILVPAPTGPINSRSVNEAVFATDLDCTNDRQLSLENGDLKLLSGTANLKQQLEAKLNVPRGRLRRHKDFGCLIPSIKGKVVGPVAVQLSSEYAKSAVTSDYRVQKVENITATTSGDVIFVSGKATAISGDSVDFEVEG